MKKLNALLVKSPVEVRQNQLTILAPYIRMINKEINKIKTQIRDCNENEIEEQNFLYAILKDYQYFLYRINLLKNWLLRGEHNEKRT